MSLKGGMIVRVLVKRGIIFYRYTCMCKSLESSICYSSNFCTRISMCMPYVTAYKYMKYGNAFRKFLSFGFYCNQNLEVLSSKKQIPRKMYRFHDSIEFHFLFFNVLLLQSPLRTWNKIRISSCNILIITYNLEIFPKSKIVSLRLPKNPISLIMSSPLCTQLCS